MGVMVTEQKKRRLVKMEPELMAFIEKEQRPRETYSQVLRRLLGIEKREGRESRRDGE